MPDYTSEDEDRQLTYAGKFVTELEQATPSVACFDFPKRVQFEDMTTPKLLMVDWSQEQFTAIVSAVHEGSKLITPDNYMEVYTLFMKIIGCDVDICEAIINCIETDPATGTALMQYLTDNGYGTGSGTPETPSIYTDNPTIFDGSQITDCDNDNLFGGITQAVDLMNQTITDAFEGFESETALFEQVSHVLSGIPITDFLALDDMVSFAENLLSNIAQNYAAEYTETIRDEYRCDLFCLSVDTCEMDFQAYADYFMGRVGESISDEGIDDALLWFITGNFLGDSIVHATHALLCQILAYGSKFFSIDMSYFAKMLTAFMNDPDPDWEILCDDCGTGCTLLDFATSDYSFVNWDISGAAGNQYVGVYSSPVWGASNVTWNTTSTVRGVAVERAINSANITLVQGSVNWERGTVTSPFTLTPLRIVLLNGAVVVYDSGNINGDDDDGNDLEYGFSMNVTANKIRIYCASDSGVSITPDGNVSVNWLKIYTDDDIGVGVPCS